LSSEPGGLVTEIRRLADATLHLARGSDLEPRVTEVVRRLDEPLRVAIAGRTKAGKSTLLNALVGERLAATDAGECTRIVTWYRRALGYRVVADLRPHGTRELTFRRQDGALEIDLGDLAVEAIERIEVGWPSSKLAELTLIDTPGLGSIDETASARTTQALVDHDSDAPGQADAVIYLMRHLHHHDSQFLEAFLDRSVAHASPINAIVVLSRPDEIGGARPDALESAAAVARRYAANARIRELASTVLPVAGLLAETGATLREDQVTWLRQLVRLDVDRRDALLRSVDRFRDPELNPLAAEIREELLERLGLFGLRTAVGLLADRRVATAAELSSALLELSGIATLQQILGERFAARADALKARSALAALRLFADELGRRSVPGADGLVADIERVEIGSHELGLLRLLHLVLTGVMATTAEEGQEIERLTGTAEPGARLGLGPGADSEEIRRTALAAIDRWRTRSGNPMSDRRTVEAAEIVIRAYEQIYATPSVDAG
jgi:GTPase Era involved in 16S rRNA processing